MTIQGYLGIDAGTQGLSIIFTNESLEVLATGEGDYDMVPGLAEGCYEQEPGDWEAALLSAVEQLSSQVAKLGEAVEILAIGISGQMHGEVIADAAGQSLGPARLWCDSRNDQEQDELTALLNVKMPKRITAARWLWTLRHRPELAERAAHLTTPAGWLAYQLTGQWNLGIGDAAGMFPIDQQTLDFNAELLERYEALAASCEVSSKPLRELLPQVRKCGEPAGTLTAEAIARFGSAAEQLGLVAGVPVAPAEGDQPAALAGSLIGSAGMVSCSFGTSVCANSVGDRAFTGVSPAVDHFCAPDGKPINMVWLRNGTTYMNTVIEMFGGAISADADRSGAFGALIPLLVSAPADCGGLLALPFMDDEPGLGVRRGGTAMLVGLNAENATPGNAAKAALLATMFNLRLGSEVLDQQSFPRKELVLSGGLTKTPELAQLLADVFNTPVSLLESAAEGTAWGAALMAKFRQLSSIDENTTPEWADFLESQAGSKLKYSPNSENVAVYEAAYQRYKRLLTVHHVIDEAISG